MARRSLLLGFLCRSSRTSRCLELALERVTLRLAQLFLAFQGGFEAADLGAGIGLEARGFLLQRGSLLLRRLGVSPMDEPPDPEQKEGGRRHPHGRAEDPPREP